MSVQFQTGTSIVCSAYDHLTLYPIKLVASLLYEFHWLLMKTFLCFSVDENVKNTKENP